MDNIELVKNTGILSWKPQINLGATLEYKDIEHGLFGTSSSLWPLDDNFILFYCHFTWLLILAQISTC